MLSMCCVRKLRVEGNIPLDMACGGERLQEESEMYHCNERRIMRLVSR